ncbi:MAG: hypothetical protein ACP5DX_04000 [Paracoccaceae bacterium]
MTVIQVYFRPHACPTKNPMRFELVETDFPDLEQALIAIDADQLICGKRLFTKWGQERGERVIIRDDVIAFRGGCVDRVELPTWRIVREVEE